MSVLCVSNRPAFWPWLYWNYERQAYRNKELVLVTTDQRGGVVRYRHVLVIEQRTLPTTRDRPPMTLGALRDEALSKASGEVVVWFDDDDWQHPDRVQWTVDALRQRPECVAVGWTRGYRVDLRSEHGYEHKNGVALHCLSGFHAEAARRVSYVDKLADKREGEDSRYMQRLERLHPLRVGSLQDRRLVSFWLRHEQNTSEPPPPTLYKVPLARIAVEVGPAAWADTTARMRDLYATLCGV